MGQSARKRVLVVDDDHDAADILVMLLQAEGCDCRAAYSGADALAAVARERPELVIVDLFMPLMSGDELARALRSAPAGDRLTLVAHTAMDSPAHQQAIQEAGFDRALLKPAALDELLRLAHDDEDEPPGPAWLHAGARPTAPAGAAGAAGFPGPRG